MTDFGDYFEHYDFEFKVEKAKNKLDEKVYLLKVNFLGDWFYLNTKNFEHTAFYQPGLLTTDKYEASVYSGFEELREAKLRVNWLLNRRKDRLSEKLK